MGRVAATIAVMAALIAGCGSAVDGQALLGQTMLCIEAPEHWVDDDGVVHEDMYVCPSGGGAIVLTIVDVTDSASQFTLAGLLDQGSMPVAGDGWMITPGDNTAARLIAERTGGTVIRTVDDITALAS